MSYDSQTIHSVLNRKLVFVHGKGGVGKTTVSQAVALRLSEKGGRTLWVTLEDPTRTPGNLQQVSPNLWHFNCDFTLAFEEYASMKIGVAQLTRLFLKNKLMRYLAKAAPGIHELVLLGKIWFERNHYDHVVIDMPSTGYGLAMFQSTENFVKLFKGGPLNRDAEEMLHCFKDEKQTGHLIVSLPEEMPLRESIELKDYLKKMFPINLPAFVVNRVFPPFNPPFRPELSPELRLESTSALDSEMANTPDTWPSPLATSAEDYAQKRFLLERYNLRLWRDEGLLFGELKFIPPPAVESSEFIVKNLAEIFQSKAYL